MKRVHKQVCATFLSVALLFAGAIPVSAETAYQTSGGKEFEKLSKQEIAILLEENTLDISSQIYEEEPSVFAPYQPGVVKTEILQSATDRLNVMRCLAGLPSVELDLDLSNQAQYGSVLLAAGGFSHYPDQPADMEESFYEQGLDATSSSNIGMGSDLLWSVDQFMYDSDSSNVSVLGHRRWQLNPTLGKVGFGVTEIPLFPFYNLSFVVEKIFDESGPGCDYDYISWPPSGYFPVAENASKDSLAFFSPLNAWSITVDTEKYGEPSLDDVSVRLTRESDGRTWDFSKTNNDINGDYFNVDNGRYGEPNCIIFRPDGIDQYQGVYTVEVFGLATSLSYQVTFFDLADADKPDPSRYFNDVFTNDWYFSAVEYAYEYGIMKGVGNSRFAPKQTVDRATAVQILYNLEGQPESTGINPPTLYQDVSSSAWYADAVYWALNTGVASGYGNGSFRPGAKITREEFAQMLYNYARYKGYDLTSGGNLSIYPDAEEISRWAVPALSWANGHGLINGHEDGTIDPQGTTTRAQAASILTGFHSLLAN